MAEQNDAELVRAAARGDKNAYGTLYDRYAPLIRAICYDRTKHPADAQDLAQDVFLRAYERLGGLHVSEMAEGLPDAADSEVLRKTVAQLPEKERLALHVFYLRGNSTPDSCRLVGLSRSGFYRALDRARKRLRKLMALELEDIR